MFPGDSSMPRAGTVDRELRDRAHNGMSYPDGVILDCNSTDYAKEEQLIRTLREQLLSEHSESSSLMAFQGH
jgi:hypothetical protein